jgi:putative transcriptional regulator
MSENSRMLQEALEGAQGLHRAGVIDMRRLQEYEALCAPVPKFTGEDVKELRDRIKVSQPVLAQLINTSASTVRAWETGQKNPGGPSCKLLDILARKGIEALL